LTDDPMQTAGNYPEHLPRDVVPLSFGIVANVVDDPLKRGTLPRDLYILHRLSFSETVARGTDREL
jgi:hypothetical protein